MRSFGFLLLATGIALAGFFISQTLTNSKSAFNIVEVKGLAERRVEADTAYWSVGQALNTREDSISTEELYEHFNSRSERIIQKLIDIGFEEGNLDIDVIRFSNEAIRDDNNEYIESERVLRGFINIETNDVHLVKEARVQMNSLIAEGITIISNEPEYHFTKLNDIKPDMIKEATRNARLAANEFANYAESAVGGIKSAKQGRFSIADVGEDYSDTDKIDKIVRVVTKIEFYLEN